MEYTFSELKKKTVISVKDGKKIGKIVDMTICYPSYEILNFLVCPCKVNLFADPVTIRPREIEKIGEDAILVNIRHYGDHCKDDCRDNRKERHKNICDEICGNFSDNDCDGYRDNDCENYRENRHDGFCMEEDICDDDE